jgi:hypothetical protein
VQACKKLRQNNHSLAYNRCPSRHSRIQEETRKPTSNPQTDGAIRWAMRLSNIDRDRPRQPFWMNPIPRKQLEARNTCAYSDTPLDLGTCIAKGEGTVAGDLTALLHSSTSVIVGWLARARQSCQLNRMGLSDEERSCVWKDQVQPQRGQPCDVFGWRCCSRSAALSSRLRFRYARARIANIVGHHFRHAERLLEPSRFQLVVAGCHDNRAEGMRNWRSRWQLHGAISCTLPRLLAGQEAQTSRRKPYSSAWWPDRASWPTHYRS